SVPFSLVFILPSPRLCLPCFPMASPMIPGARVHCSAAVNSHPPSPKILERHVCATGELPFFGILALPIGRAACIPALLVRVAMRYLAARRSTVQCSPRFVLTHLRHASDAFTVGVA